MTRDELIDTMYEGLGGDVARINFHDIADHILSRLEAEQGADKGEQGGFRHVDSIFVPDLPSLIIGLEKVRKKLCCYFGPTCDCKYGANTMGKGGEETGCPEIRAAIAIIKDVMRDTPKQEAVEPLEELAKSKGYTSINLLYGENRDKDVEFETEKEARAYLLSLPDAKGEV